MADVPCVLLDRVDQDAPQAGWLSPSGVPDQLVQAADGQRLVTTERERATASCQSVDSRRARLTVSRPCR